MPSTLKGYLFKLGVKGVIKLYKKRWCVLPENEDVLYYYESKVDLKLCGSIKLKDILHTSTSKNSSFNQGSSWGFELTTPGRVYSMYASSEQDRIYWIEGITARINILRKKPDDNSSAGGSGSYGSLGSLGSRSSVNSSVMIEHNNSTGTPQKVKIINDYGFGAHGTPPTVLEFDSDDGLSETSSVKGGQPSKEKELEKEVEIKENLIEKLEEEKQAFAKYAKELEDERSALQSENEKILQQLEENNDLDKYKAQIKQLEKEKDEIYDDLKTLETELEEERSSRMKLLAEKQSLQINFSQEKNVLIQKAEESETSKKKVIELMQSGQYLSPQSDHQQNNNNSSNNSINSSKKKDYNWSKLLLTIEKHVYQYRKQRDSYFLTNINLKKFLKESLRSSGKYDNPLFRYRETLDTLENSLRQFEKNGGDLERMLSIVNSELVQCLAFANGEQPHFPEENDRDLESFVDILAVKEISDTDSMLIDKKTLRHPLEKLIEDAKQLDATQGQTEMDHLQEQWNVWNQCYDRGEQKIKRCIEVLKKVFQETKSAPQYLESVDTFELRVESLISKLEPYLDVDDESESTTALAEMIENPEQLKESCQTLSKDLTDHIVQLKNDHNKSSGYQNECQELLLNIDKQTELTSNELDESMQKQKQDIQCWNDSRQEQLVQLRKLITKLLELKKKMVLIRGLAELQKKEYIANENDQLDVMVESVIHSLNDAANNTDDDFDDDEVGSGGYRTGGIKGLLPPNFQRISEGLYQFGSRRINASILSGNLVVRVGGGFQTFEEFVHKYGRSETIKLLRQSNGSSIATAIRTNFRESRRFQSPDKRYQSLTKFGSVV